MIISNKGMTVIKVMEEGSREDVFVDFAVVVHSLKGALVEGGMSSDKAEALVIDTGESSDLRMKEVSALVVSREKRHH